MHRVYTIGLLWALTGCAGKASLVTKSPETPGGVRLSPVEASESVTITVTFSQRAGRHGVWVELESPGSRGGDTTVFFGANLRSHVAPTLVGPGQLIPRRDKTGFDAIHRAGDRLRIRYWVPRSAFASFKGLPLRNAMLRQGRTTHLLKLGWILCCPVPTFVQTEATRWWASERVFVLHVRGIPAGESVLSGLGVGRRVAAISTFYSIGETVLVTGHYQVWESTTTTAGTRLAIATGSWTLSGASLRSLTTQANAAIQRAFPGAAPPFALIVYGEIPFEVPYHLPSGQAVGNTAIIAVRRQTPLDDLQNSLLHELIHVQLHRGVDRQPQSAVYFSMIEGIASFYAATLSSQAYRRRGLPSAEDVTMGAELFFTATAYETWLRTAPGPKADLARRNLPLLRQVLAMSARHVRGALFTAALHDELVRRRHVSTFLHRLAARTQAKQRPLRPGELLALMRDLLPNPVVTRLHQRLTAPGRPVLPITIGPCFKRVRTPVALVDLGLDRSESLAQHKVQGVTRDSSAYAAGLRNGQSLRAIELVKRPGGVFVKVTISVDGRERTVAYNIRGRRREIWTLGPDPSKVTACRAWLAGDTVKPR